MIPHAPDFYVKKGGTVTATCHVINSKHPSKFIKWYHKNKEVNYGPGTPRVRTTFSAGVNSSCNLTVMQVTKEDTGRYMCYPSNSYEAYLSIHMVEGKLSTAS